MAALGITVALLVWMAALLLISIWKHIYSSWKLPPGLSTHHWESFATGY